LCEKKGKPPEGKKMFERNLRENLATHRKKKKGKEATTVHKKTNTKMKRKGTGDTKWNNEYE